MRGRAWTADEANQRLASLSAPESIRAVAKEVIENLKTTRPTSKPHLTAQQRLEWLLEFPWEANTERRGLREVEEAFAKSILNQEEAKEKVLESLSLYFVDRESAAPVLCLTGPSGTGKTLIARTMASALGRKLVQIRIGGLRTEIDVFGHNAPGQIAQAFRRAQAIDPVVLIEDIHRVKSDVALTALLDSLDPMGDAFEDRYLGVPIRLDKAIFIMTCQSVTELPCGWQGRIRVIPLDSYVDEEKVEIATKHLVPELAERAGIAPPKFSAATMSHLIRNYTREPGVSELASRLETVLRKLSLRRLRGETVPEKVTRETIKALLGPDYYLSIAPFNGGVGMVNGLAETSMGGEIMPIEIVATPGEGNISLTGNLGNVLRESAQIAHTWVKTRADRLRIPYERFNQVDLHIHLPEGACPKDGPSAGLGFALAIASVMTGRRVRNGFSITGELTVHGDAIAIGGLAEKLSAARREGVRKVIIPEKNLSDLYWIRPAVLEKLDIVPVQTMDDVLSIALC